MGAGIFLDGSGVPIDGIEFEPSTSALEISVVLLYWFVELPYMVCESASFLQVRASAVVGRLEPSSEDGVEAGALVAVESARVSLVEVRASAAVAELEPQDEAAAEVIRLV